MTLLLGILTARGAWISSDHRLYDAVRMQPLQDDPSNKQLHLKCKDGSFVLAYTGIGRFAHPVMGEVHVSEWVRRFLRGRQLGAEESIVRIMECSNTRLASLAKGLNSEHTFAVVAFLQGGLYAVEVTNFVGGQVSAQFQLQSLAVTKDNPLVLRAGLTAAVSVADFALLSHLAKKIPANYKDYARVLSDVNARAAARSDERISGSCETTYVPIRGEPFYTNLHNPDGGELPTSGLMMLSIDLTGPRRQMAELLDSDETFDEDKFRVERNELLAEAVSIEDC